MVGKHSTTEPQFTFLCVIRWLKTAYVVGELEGWLNSSELFLFLFLFFVFSSKDQFLKMDVPGIRVKKIRLKGELSDGRFLHPSNF